MERVLITGGAGFIGSHLADHLIDQGCEVMVFDCLVPQAHPNSPKWPSYMREDGTLWVEREGLHPWFGDVRDQRAVHSALLDFKPDTVIHLAARVGMAQGDEQIANYVSSNVTGTAVLLNCLVHHNRLVKDRAEALAHLDEEVEITPSEYVETGREIPDTILGDIARGDTYEVWFPSTEDSPGGWGPTREVPAQLVGLSVGDPDDHDEILMALGLDPLDDDSLAVRIKRPSQLVPETRLETQAEAEARYEAWRIDERQRIESLPAKPVKAVFIAGSMSAYGEGAYLADSWMGLERIRGQQREPESLAAGMFDAAPPDAEPVGLHEGDELMPGSVYAITKATQEQLGLVVGKAHGISVYVGRFFNVFGERQALDNPYTGVGAIFAARALSGRAPLVYEDGKQIRDFIHVSDVCRAIEVIIEKGEPGVYNVGTGRETTVGRSRAHRHRTGPRQRYPALLRLRPQAPGPRLEAAGDP